MMADTVSLFPQPRSQELHKVLGTLPGIEAVARPAQTVKMYQAPGGVKPIRALTMFPYTQPTAAYPYVGLHCVLN